MAKGILEFNLPEEQSEFKNATKANKYIAALWDFSNYLREAIKYQDLDEEDLKIYEHIQKVFYEIVGDLLED